MLNLDKFGIEVNFLTGRCVSSSHNNRKRPEWPPHPARLFSAMVAAWVDAEEPDLSERAALEWLETLPPPSIAASDAVPRTVVFHFVPVNDPSIIPRKRYEQRANRISDLTRELQRELSISSGEITKKAARTQCEITKLRDVENQVLNTGNTNPSSALEMFPEYRGKQERFFPSTTPDEPCVTYLWNIKPQDNILQAFDRLLKRVTRLGHSSSLVSCRIVTDTPEPNRIPSDEGESMRALQTGQLKDLEKRHTYHMGTKPRSLPYIDVRYRTLRNTISSESLQMPNTAGEWIVFEFSHESRNFPPTKIVELATAMHVAILHYSEEPIPEEISGHRMDGSPTIIPHVSFLPLPNIGFEHSDGRILGIAVSLPNVLKESSRRAVLRTIGRWENEVSTLQSQRNKKTRTILRLTLGTEGVVNMYRLRSPTSLVSLRPSIWQHASHHWVSATPIALPRHPGSLSKGTSSARAKAWAEAESAVRTACSHVGLPEPLSVKVSLSPFLIGAKPVRSYPIFNQRNRNGKKLFRQLVHASLTFKNLVSGPLVVGSGRFRGLGLMRPVAGPDENYSDHRKTKQASKVIS